MREPVFDRVHILAHVRRRAPLLRGARPLALITSAPAPAVFDKARVCAAAAHTLATGHGAVASDFTLAARFAAERLPVATADWPRYRRRYTLLGRTSVHVPGRALHGKAHTHATRVRAPRRRSHSRGRSYPNCGGIIAVHESQSACARDKSGQKVARPTRQGPPPGGTPAPGDEPTYQIPLWTPRGWRASTPVACSAGNKPACVCALR